MPGKNKGGYVGKVKRSTPGRTYRQWFSQENRKQIDAAVSDGTFTATEAAAIGKEICQQGFDTQTRHMAGQALQKALDALQHLPQGEEQIMLRQMTDYVQNRQK